MFDLFHVGLLVNGGVGRDLVAENLRHLNREDAFLEHALALDDQIMRVFQSVDVHVPVHPLGRTNRFLRPRLGIRGTRRVRRGHNIRLHVARHRSMQQIRVQPVGHLIWRSRINHRGEVHLRRAADLSKYQGVRKVHA